MALQLYEDVMTSVIATSKLNISPNILIGGNKALVALEMILELVKCSSQIFKFSTFLRRPSREKLESASPNLFISSEHYLIQLG